MRLTLVYFCSKTPHKFKKFERIPTLKSYPLIGHSYLFFPAGKYKSEKLTEAFLDISKTLGPIFTLNLGGTSMVVTLNPNDTRTLFENEGKTPERPVFEALLHYRRGAFNSVGVVPASGEEWRRLRKGVNPLLQLKLIDPYKEKQREIADNFVKYVKLKRHEGVLGDVFQHFLKFTIEAISVVSPGHHFPCLLSEEEESKKIIEASVDFMDGLYRTLIEPPVWKIWKTQGYKKLERSHNIIYNILKTHLENTKNSNPDNLKKANPLMHSLFNNNNLPFEDKVMLAIEVFLGGIDATATTLAFTCYFLGQNRNIQEMARSKGPDFLRACIKETLRLAPTAGGNARFLIREAVMSGFLVPKGTLVLSMNSALAKSNYFQEPQRYNPERFFKDTKEDFHKYASLPFGYGPRMCPGKRVAEQEMIILLSQILENFILETVGSTDVGMVFRMNRIPDKRINIKCIDR